ncbi:MAG TPA: response regulator [Chloroflexota bacterium]|nr:response regulator [Chloroflexota bacterium]HUM70501.1 response regulator [Chloroflexota bacterium]
MRHRILLADDHALVRAGIANALAGLPDVEIVAEVGDGPSLGPALARWQPDCLLIDVTMPAFDPIVEIRRIRAQYPEMRVLVVSAYDDDVYVQGLLGVGVNGYHLKDQPLSDLRLAVMRVLAGERWISSSLVDKLLHPARVTAVPPLSTRQQDILRLLAEGLDNRAIAQRLNLSVKTVENHLTRLYRQIDVQSRLEAATYVREHPELLAHVARPFQDEPLPVYFPPSEQGAILVVDDNGRYRTQLRRIIGKIFPQTMIYEAANTADAVHLAARVMPQVAFVDVVLGDEDGIRCTRRLKGQSPSTRIILISAYPDREFHRLGLEAGATAFVDKKDLDAATLQQIIVDVIS